MAAKYLIKRRKVTTARSGIPTNNFPQALCPDHVTDLAQRAAVKAREAAEAYFSLQNISYAIKQATAAKIFDPELLGIDNYVTAYEIHSAVYDKKSWYHVLGIQNPRDANCETIKKQYKKLALVLNPDKNASIAAEGAFKYVKAAWDVLSDPSKRAAYDRARWFHGAACGSSCNRKPPQQQQQQRHSSKAYHHKRAGPDADAGTSRGGGSSYYKKTFKFIRTTKSGQKTSFINISICRVA